MALFTTPTEKTAAEISKLREAREKLEAENRADRAKLAELRTGQGDVELAELLGGNRPAKPKDGLPASISDAHMLRLQIFEVEARIQGRASARPKLFGRIREAVKAYAHARAEVIRKDAEKLREKYDTHEAKTRELLEALEQHAGIRYQMNLLPPLPNNFVYLENSLPRMEPKSAAMAREIGKLLAAADRIEADANRTCEGGVVTGESLEQLLSAIGDNPLAPLRPEVEAWYSDAATRSDTEWKNGLGVPIAGAPPPFENGNPLFTFAWVADAVIDQHRSGFVNRERRVSGGYPSIRPPVLPFPDRAA